MSGTPDAALASIAMGVRAGQLEDDILEFKTVAATIKETLKLLADAAVCFANAAGGTIVLGVADDRAGVDAFESVPLGYSVDTVRKGIFDRTRPQLTCFVEEREEHGNRLIVVSVPPGVGTCSNASGLATRRMGDACLPFTPDQQREVLVARGQIDWSAESSDVDSAVLTEADLALLRSLLKRAGKDDLAAMERSALLSDLRLREADGRLTNAALVLLAPEELLATKLPSYGYSYQYRPTPGAEATHRTRGRKPLLTAVELLIGYVEARRQIEPLSLPGGVQFALADYPVEAVRELVINALIHRSYETHGTVDVEHSVDQLAIASPGGFVAGVTPANILTHPSTPRNRLLTETVAVLQLAERTGQGVDRVFREMLRNGKEPPTFHGEDVLVRAVLAGGTGNKSFVRYVAELPDAIGRDVDALLTLSLLRHRRTIDAEDLAEVTQRTPAEAQRTLMRLADELVIEPTKRTSNKTMPKYRLRPGAIAGLARAVSYYRPHTDAADDKVLEHVREYGHITNRTVQRMFDVDVYRARNMLTDLRRRGLIEKIGDARGGPGVRYGPPRKGGLSNGPP